MELLTITHKDFEMIIECDKFDDLWGKAKNNIGENGLLSKYSWTEGVKKVTRRKGEEEVEIENGGETSAIFFDNADYPIWVEFNNDVTKARFGSELQGENDRFSFRRHILAGFLNYGNDIGRSEINLIYEKEGKEYRFTFSFEVLSTKLDYHKHWRRIIEDIESEYRMLSLDYMRRTFHGFNPDPQGDTPELIWWSVFAEEQVKFIGACKSIIERPRHRLHGREIYKRADRLTLVPRSIENELAEHSKEEGYLYRVEDQVQTNDTQENRFLKFALSQITAKYETLKNRIEDLATIDINRKKEIEDTFKTLQRLGRNPFFRTVGKYKGMSQESMVLQKATGYSQVYRTWNLLRRGYSLYDGMYRLQTKDIATLYEIWCFIEVSHIIKEQLGLEDKDVEHRKRMEMNGLFTWELGKGEHSLILFKKGGVEVAELVYNPKITQVENNSGIKDWEVPTVPQKPDIVLQLTKDDLQKGMKMSYLFDAKYRIGVRQNGVDAPPDDAINQMHRYRDAIYYKDNKADGGLKKEVIGGYILFPGEGERAGVEVANFYKTIEKVNIGAFPLRPGDEENRELLKQFIGQLIENKSYETITKVIPQKGTIVEVGNRVLIGVVSGNSRGNASKSRFQNSTATLYYTGKKFPTTIPLQDLHFFMPYIKDQGIRDVYKIKKIRTITAKEAKQLDDNEGENDIRLAFEIEFVRQQYPDYRPIDISKLKFYTFIDTTFDELNELIAKKE